MITVMTNLREEETVLIPPYGGKLKNLAAEGEERKELIEKAKFLPSIQISYRSQCDFELLSVGAFSPLDRFMGQKDYRSVLKEMRLSNGTLFPMPITLPVENIKDVAIGREIALRSRENTILGVMRVEEIYEWDLEEEAEAVFGTIDSRHSLVSEMHTWGKYYLSGPLTTINLPKYYDFPDARKSPREVREILEARKLKNVISFLPSNPMHRAHEAFVKKIIEEIDGSLLLMASVGVTRRGYLDDYTRVRCYSTLLKNYFDPDKFLLNLLPVAVRIGGPRAALWHGIINRNYGANYMIVGRDNVVQGRDSQGKDFYDLCQVPELFIQHEEEVGVQIIPFRKMVYVPKEDGYVDFEKVKREKKEYFMISGTRVLEDSWSAERLPEWFTRPEIAQILHEVNPPRTKRGFCVWLTGLPSSGKSTIADILVSQLMARGKKITLMDGDRVRTHLSKGLGFTKEDRLANILRVGFIAGEIVRHNGVVVCALISPYASARNKVRAMIGEDKFIEVFIDTPLEECVARDVKGMYALARRGQIKGFTGVDDPYERPVSPELIIQTVAASPEESAKKIVQELIRRGLIKGGDAF